MVLVDTSVWIDHFNGANNTNTDLLKSAIDEAEDIGTCGIVCMEILQGIRKERDLSLIRSILDDLLYLPEQRSTYVAAADMYRYLRKKGVTIRKPVDCIIAALCLECSAFLLHNDRDFEMISRHFPLQRYT